MELSRGVSVATIYVDEEARLLAEHDAAQCSFECRDAAENDRTVKHIDAQPQLVDLARDPRETMPSQL